MAKRRAAFAAIFARRGPACDAGQAAGDLAPLLRATAVAVLAELYPAAMEAAHVRERA